MFTGIVEGIGRIEAVHEEGGNRRFSMHAPFLLADLHEGDSLAHDGVCLTIERLLPQGYEVVAVAETLSVTALGDRRAGDGVNLERAATPSTRLGGHYVQGHVDGVARALARAERDGSVEWTLEVPEFLARYCVARGSIALDGVSLTLSAVEGTSVRVNLIPHTLEVTTLQDWVPGRRINVEVDLLAKYVEKLLPGHRDA